MNAISTLDLFRALADEVRLRIVFILKDAELSVAEMVDVLGLPQSTVSRHLKPLRDAGLLGTRREGTSVYYRRGDALSEPDIADLLGHRLSGLPAAKADTAAVHRVLDQRRRRSRDFFERMAGRYGGLTQPGGGWEALAAALAAGFAGRTVVDIGSGEGSLSLLLARFAATVTAIDQSPAMRKEVAKRAKNAGVGSHVIVREGDLERLPLADGSQDAAFLSQALHHAAQPARAIAEAARVLRPGGRLIVLDLARHDQEWMREQWADQWLGFGTAELRTWMEQAGLRVEADVQIEGAAPDVPVLLMVGERNKQ